ncbi:hypothetical protein ACF0H5_010414 [Mactra antiquata]
MARGRHKRTVIQVKSAPTTNVVYNLVDLSTETNRNVQKITMLPKLLEVVPLWNENTDTANDHCGTHVTQCESAEDYVTEMKQITPREDDGHNRIEDGLVDVNMKPESMTDDVNVAPSINADDKEIEKKIKKKKNKRKKKNKKTTEKFDLDAPESCIQDGRPVRLEPINKGTNASKVMPKSDDMPKLKPVGCFGFISTWLAKRKEKRRQKKRKAINARKEANTEPLVEYEHRRARGGLAFTIELDSRPIMKSVLPPIKQRPGPTYIKYTMCVFRQEVAERRVENEMQFKQTTLLKIRDKEFKASRAPSRLEYDRNMRCQSRCKSRIRHTPNLFTCKPKITLSSSPITEVNEMPSSSPLSLDDVPLTQYFIDQDVCHEVE